MIVSRIALLMAAAAAGYLMTCADEALRTPRRSVGDTRDLADLASQLSTQFARAVPREREGDRPVPRPPSADDRGLRLVAYDARQVMASMRNDQPNPFQLIPPEITAKPELIPGHWKARHRQATDFFGEPAREADPWISELRAPQPDWQAATWFVPAADIEATRARSERR